MVNFVHRLVGCTLALAASSFTASAQQQHSYVAEANREYAAIFSHPDNPCATKGTTSSYLDCIGKEVTFTELHLANFLIAIRGIASHDDAGGSGKTNERSLVNNANAAWQQYRKSICDLTEAGMAGGSGQSSAGQDCIYSMDRKYVQQLADATYLHTLAE